MKVVFILQAIKALHLQRSATDDGYAFLIHIRITSNVQIFSRYNQNKDVQNKRLSQIKLL